MLKFDWAVVQDERVVASVREHLNQVLTEKTGGKFSLTALHFGVQVPRRGGVGGLVCARPLPYHLVLRLAAAGDYDSRAERAWPRSAQYQVRVTVTVVEIPHESASPQHKLLV
jgi:hypothetical protein